MRVRLLGPVEVVGGAGTRPVRGLRRKAVLAMLALNRGDVVSVDRLVDAVWSGTAPPGVANTLQSHVSHLRQVLGSRTAIVARAPGYVLDLDGGATDVELAEHHIEQGTRAADPATAVAHLREALALWRGRPLADVTELPFLDEQATRLDGLWLRAKLALVDALLALGEHDQAVRDLEALVGDHPFDERIHGQLMVALYRSGRQVDALRVLHDLRGRLDTQLGIDVGKGLRDLETAILRQDAALAAPVSPAPVPPAPVPPAPATGPSPVPAQLPLAVGVFVGRSAQLSTLDELLSTVDLPRVAVVSGTAGVGKTTLALHWAHRVAHHFPDGQLYVNLRGFDPGERPVDPARALQEFLEALGTPATRVPVDPDGRAAAYQSLLTGRRLLIVLDNARDADQVRPLLPGTPGCVVVVTSREPLSSLAARPVPLELLSTVESEELLGRRLGPARVAGEAEAVIDIIHRCAGLPLALVIVAARAVSQPLHPLSMAASELRGTGALDALQGGDAATDIRTVFLWSYRTLRPDTAKLFRGLGLHPGPDVSLAAAACGAGLAPQYARTLLGELVRAYLVTEDRAGRYAMHDLLRAYAIEQAHLHDSPDQRRVALVRALDHYVRTAYAAAEVLEPSRVPVPPASPSLVDAAAFADRDSALAWFTAEHRVLLAAVERAGTEQCDAHAWQLAYHLAPYLHPRGFWHDQAVIGQIALQAAQRLDDRSAQAHTHRAIGAAYGQLGLLDEARGQYERTLSLCQRTGDRLTAARTHLSLAWVWERLQDPAQGVPHTERALVLYRSAGDRVGEARALNALGWAHALTGRYELAVRHCDQALLLTQELGDREAQAWTWDSLGYAHKHLGDHRQAVACYQRAADIVAELADPYTESEVLTALGDAYEAAGDVDAARRTWARALEILEAIEHRDASRVRAKLAAASSS
jgi:DNA-binding SARP family transcriptional activator/Flp pilus assembly protein TadD